MKLSVKVQHSVGLPNFIVLFKNAELHRRVWFKNWVSINFYIIQIPIEHIYPNSRVSIDVFGSQNTNPAGKLIFKVRFCKNKKDVSLGLTKSTWTLSQVGVDPLLRTSIWNHLVEMSATNKSLSASETKLANVNGGTSPAARGTTIVITTHYIEEARQANRVGMMRFGKLLAQGSPEELLRR